MDDTQKVIIERWRWCKAAGIALAGSILRAPCYAVEDYRQAVIAGASLYRVRLQSSGAVLGWVILRIERASAGAEGVILAASASLEGVSLTAQVLPAIEKMFQGVKSVRIETARPGLVRMLSAAGYQASHMVMRKAVA